jgi:hypothetical protein
MGVTERYDRAKLGKEEVMRIIDAAARFSDDPLYHRLWMDDLRYFRACDFFSGKHPPDFSKMNVYASGSREIVCGRA